MGSQTARVCTHPSYVRTHGPGAARLAASAGLHLDPWQAEVLNVILGVREDGRFACFESCFVVPRQNGKGAIFEALVLYKLFVLRENLIMWSAHQLKTASESFRRILALVDAQPKLKNLCKKPVHRKGEEALQLLTGQRVLFHARSNKSMRGFSPSTVILDEAFDIVSEDMASLLPTLSAQPSAQVVYASTPPLGAAESEHLKKLRVRGERGTDTSLAWWDWSVDPGTDLDDRQGWAQANPALGIRIREESVERERNALKDEDFARERLGIWPSLASEHVVEQALWSSLADKGSQPGEKLAFAVDVSPDRVSTVAVAGVRADGLMHVELIHRQTGTDWVPNFLLAIKEKHNPVAIALDIASPGANLLIELEKVGIAKSANFKEPKAGELIVPYERETRAACLALVDAINEKTIRHLDDPVLNVAIGTAKKKPSGGAWVWDRNSGASPLYAITLAKWAFESRAHLITEEYLEPSILWLGG